MLSIGRVQTPTLALIVNRQLEIEHFEPKQYWVLSTLYRDTTFTAILKKSEEDLMADIEKQKEKAEKAGQPFDVTETLRKAEAANPALNRLRAKNKVLLCLNASKKLHLPLPL